MKRILNSLYLLWIDKGYYIAGGISLGALAFWLLYPYVIVFLYDSYKQLSEASGVITFLVILGVFSLIAFLLMAYNAILVEPKVGKTKFKHK